MFSVWNKNLQTAARRLAVYSSQNVVAVETKLPQSFIAPIRTVSTYVHDERIHNEQLFPKPKRWAKYNQIVHAPEDGPVERYVCHFRDNIKYSPKKMFFIAGFIQGMNVDEAIKQLSYIPKKGASVVKEVLEEARELAIREHNFEYKSKMWIAESFCTKGMVIKGFRKHARARYGEVRYFHTHYFVKLVEGEPPKNYSNGPDLSKLNTEERLDDYIEKLRNRRIDFAL